MAAPMKCCLHLVEDENSKITSISALSYKRIYHCATQWLRLDGIEHIIAKELIENAENSSCNHSNSASCSFACQQCLQDQNWGYHRRCYICALLTKQRLIEVIDIFVYHFDKFCLIGFIYLTNSVYHSFQNNVHVPATEQADEIKSLYEKQHCAKQKQGKMEVIEEFFSFFFLFIYLSIYVFIF